MAEESQSGTTAEENPGETTTEKDPGATTAGESAAEKDPGGTTAGEGASETTDITAGPGGVMTDEVGVITGDLTLRSELADGEVTLRVQYKEAEEWYVVTGGRAPLADPADLRAVHRIAVGLLNRPEG